CLNVRNFPTGVRVLCACAPRALYGRHRARPRDRGGECQDLPQALLSTPSDRNRARTPDVVSGAVEYVARPSFRTRRSGPSRTAYTEVVPAVPFPGDMRGGVAVL